MQQAFEEPQRQRTSTEFSSEVTGKAISTESGSVNKKLLAVFSIPLLLVFAGLAYAKKYVDILDESDNLEKQVAIAKKAGFPFSASELEPKNFNEADNSYNIMKKNFMDEKNPVPKNALTDLTYFDQINQPTLDPGTKELILRAKEVAKFTRFNAHRDLDQGFNVLYPEFAHFKSVAKALAYDAVFQAKHGNHEAAIESLRQSLNLPRQLNDEKVIIGMLVNVACQSIIYRAFGDVAHELNDDPPALDQLSKLLEEEIPVPAFRDSMNAEFYGVLCFMRNFSSMNSILQSYSSEYGEDLSPEPEPPKLVRGGLPKSAIARGLLSKVIERYVQFQEIIATEKDPLVAGQKMDALMISSDRKLSELLVEILSPVYAQAMAATFKPNSSRGIAQFALDIERKYKGKYPESLLPRKDPGFGGQLIYRPYEDGFIIYSTGPDKIDQGGPNTYKKHDSEGPNDDFAFRYPLQIKVRPDSAKSGGPGPRAPNTDN